MGKPSEKWIRQRRAELGANCSDAERVAYRNLQRLGYSAIRQFPIWTKRKIYFADLFVPSLKLIIEIDGGYHFTKNQRRFDSNRSNGLWRLGYHVVRLSNHDARDIGKMKAKILLVLRRKS